MRKSLIAATALVGGALLSTSAFAATKMDTGVIMALQSKNHRVQLADGKWFMFPSRYSFKGLKVGEKVSVQYNIKHKRFYGTSIKAAA